MQKSYYIYSITVHTAINSNANSCTIIVVCNALFMCVYACMDSCVCVCMCCVLLLCMYMQLCIPLLSSHECDLVKSLYQICIPLRVLHKYCLDIMGSSQCCTYITCECTCMIMHINYIFVLTYFYPKMNCNIWVIGLKLFDACISNLKEKCMLP